MWLPVLGVGNQVFGLSRQVAVPMWLPVVGER